MRRLTVTYNQFDVVVVPFPFTDRDSTKRRPALVLSDKTFQSHVGHSILAMITSSENPEWLLDSEIEDLESAGLPAPSKVRMKLFTLDDNLVIRKIGSLSKPDRKSVLAAARRLLGV
jgi:mRNA interferase MazF